MSESPLTLFPVFKKKRLKNTRRNVLVRGGETDTSPLRSDPSLPSSLLLPVSRVPPPAWNQTPPDFDVMLPYFVLHTSFPRPTERHRKSLDCFTPH